MAFQPTKEMPLMAGMRLRMLQALEHPSYYELSLLLEELADDLTKNPPSFGISEMLNAVAKDIVPGGSGTMVQLLHQIPQKLLRSIILGTVAYDYGPARGNLSGGLFYSGSGPGTYVAAVSIQGRGNRFLRPSEIERLAHQMEAYADAVSTHWDKQAKSWRNTPAPAAEEAAKLVQKIDNVYLSKPRAVTGQARFANSDLLPGKIRTIAQRLRQRTDPAIVGNKDMVQVQSPLMVGCAAQNISERVKGHLPANGLHSTTGSWGLMLSILSNMGLQPLVTVLPVVRARSRDQLSLSETLVTLLAQSLANQDGVNVTGSGSHHGTAKVTNYFTQTAKQEADMEVYVFNSFLKENLDRTAGAIQAYLKRAEISKAPNSTDAAGLEAPVKRLQTYAFRIELFAKICARLRRELVASLEALEAENRQLECLASLTEELDQSLGAEGFGQPSGDNDQMSM